MAKGTTQPRTKAPKFKVTPEQYNAFIKQVDLNWVYLESCSTKRHRLPNLEASISYDEKVGRRSYEHTDDGFRALFNYQIKLVEAEQETPFAEIKCIYAAEYSSEIPMDDNIFSVFRELNLPLNVWPYVREFVHGTTSRMGLPALVLRSLKR